MTPEELEARLGSEDVEVRRLLVVELAAGDDPGCANALLAALGDEDVRVREEAVFGLARASFGMALVPRLVAAVCEPEDIARRNAARQALQHLGAPAAPQIIAALPAVAPEARKFLVDALAASGQRAVDTLTLQLADSDAPTALAIIDALGAIGGERAQATLQAQLGSRDGMLQAAALSALDRLGAKLPYERLASLAQDAVLRRLALPLLARTADVRALPHVLPALADRSELLAARVVLALSSCDGAAAAALGDALAGASDAVRERVSALARSDDREIALGATRLLALAHDELALVAAAELAARGASLASLAPLFGPLGERALDQLLSAEQPSHGARAVSVLLACEVAKTMPSDAARLSRLRSALRELSVDAEHELADGVLTALGVHGGPDDAATLVGQLASHDAAHATAAALALRALSARAPAAVSKVLATVPLTGAGAEIIAALLVELSASDAFERLRTALLSDEPGQRIAALSGLARLGGSSALELVRLALGDDASEVQVAAVAALSVLGRSPDSAHRAYEALLELQSSAPEVQVALARVLADPAASVEARDALEQRLRELARSPANEARLHALLGLSRLRGRSCVELFVEALSDPDPEVVGAAIVAIGESGDEHAGSRIAVALEHAAWNVRAAAAIRLERVHGSPAVQEALRSRLSRETDEYVRQALASALQALASASERAP